MNHWNGTGRVTRDIEVITTGGEKPVSVARFTVACNRKFKKNGQDEADFISCVAFGKTAEWLSKYVHKGTKIEIDGRIQTGSYEKDGKKIYTTDVVAEEVEFAESKKVQEETNALDDFVNVTEANMDELPFA